MGEGQNGGGGAGDPGIQQAAKAMAVQLFHELSGLCPAVTEEARWDAAMRAVQGLQGIAQLMAAYRQNEPPLVYAAVFQKSAIMPSQPAEGIRVVGYKDLAKCQSLDEAVRSANVLSLATSPLTRALLIAHGYDIEFGQANFAPDTESEEQPEAADE